MQPKSEQGDIFDWFTEKSFNVIRFAQEESLQLGHNFVGTEHLLLGLLRDDTTIAGIMLKRTSLSLEEARVEVEKMIGRGPGGAVVEISFTPRAKRVLEHAWAKAKQLNHKYIEPEHLLLGIIREGSGGATTVLANQGVELSRLRDDVTRAIRDSGGGLTRSEDSIFDSSTRTGARALRLGQEVSRKLGHNYVGTEQLLLGLLEEGTGVAAKALKGMGVTLKDAWVEVERIIGRGSDVVGSDIPFTPRLKRVLELSWDEARQLGHNYMGTEHLLLGILREDTGVAVRVLENLGVDLSKLGDSVMLALREDQQGR